VAPPPIEQPGTSAAWSRAIAGTYERFLELPVWVVLGVMWLVGVMLIGSLALVLYLLVIALI
jgi:type VI protein secretion system component VasF